MNQEKILIKDDGYAILYPGFFDLKTSNRIFLQLYNQINWQQKPITLFGKTVMQPRLTAYYGEKKYKYSGLVLQPQPWTSPLLEIKSKIELIEKLQYNAVLLNLYRNGNDSMGWHSDDEGELVKNANIASVSFGETRRFMFRRRDNHKIKIECNLGHGDLLIMTGKIQKFWQHQLPKTGKKMAAQIKPRINLTFRVIK